MLTSRLATRLGGGRLKIKKKVFKKKKTHSVASNNSSILQGEQSKDHHIMFNTKTTSATSSPESASLFTVEMNNEPSNENVGTDDEKHTTNTVSMSTTATVSSVTGTVYSGT